MCKLLLSWSLDVYEYLYSNNRRLQIIKNRLVFKCWCVALAQLWFHLNAVVLFFVITHRRIYLDLFYVFMHILWKNTAGDISFVFMLLCMSNWGRKKKKRDWKNSDLLGSRKNALMAWSIKPSLCCDGCKTTWY